MKIIDLTEDKKDLFCLCLEDGSDETKEAGPKRRPKPRDPRAIRGTHAEQGDVTMAAR